MNFNHNFHLSWQALHQSFTLMLGDFMHAWRKHSSSSALFDGLWPSIFLLITFQRFSMVQVWRLGWPWQGLDLVVFHPHLDCFGCVAWSIVLLKKTILRVGEHCQSRRKQVFFQDNLIRGLIHASFTKTNLPDSSLAEAPPDHHQSCTKFHKTWRALQATVSHTNCVRHSLCCAIILMLINQDIYWLMYQIYRKFTFHLYVLGRCRCLSMALSWAIWIPVDELLV